MRSQVDYDACYRVLELKPGATLKHVEDQARFLRAAFHPDRFQGNLKELASEKLKNINIAVDALRAYWKTYGAAPPGMALGPPKTTIGNPGDLQFGQPWMIEINASWREKSC